MNDEQRILTLDSIKEYLRVNSLWKPTLATEHSYALKLAIANATACLARYLTVEIKDNFIPSLYSTLVRRSLVFDEDRKFPDSLICDMMSKFKDFDPNIPHSELTFDLLMSSQIIKMWLMFPQFNEICRFLSDKEREELTDIDFNSLLIYSLFKDCLMMKAKEILGDSLLILDSAFNNLELEDKDVLDKLRKHLLENPPSTALDIEFLLYNKI